MGIIEETVSMGPHGRVFVEVDGVSDQDRKEAAQHLHEMGVQALMAGERMLRRARQKRIRAAVLALVGFGLETAGIIVLWRINPLIVLGVFLWLWGYGITVVRAADR